MNENIMLPMLLISQMNFFINVLIVLIKHQTGQVEHILSISADFILFINLLSVKMNHNISILLN